MLIQEELRCVDSRTRASVKGLKQAWGQHYHFCFGVKGHSKLFLKLPSATALRDGCLSWQIILKGILILFLFTADGHLYRLEVIRMSLPFWAKVAILCQTYLGFCVFFFFKFLIVKVTSTHRKLRKCRKAKRKVKIFTLSLKVITVVRAKLLPLCLCNPTYY